MKRTLLLIGILFSSLTFAQTVNPALHIWNDITCDVLVIDNDTFVFGNSTITANTVEFAAGGNYSLSLIGSAGLDVCTINFTENLQRIFFSNGNGAHVNVTCENPESTMARIINSSTLSVDDYIKSTYSFDGNTINFTSETKGEVYDILGKKLLQFNSDRIDLTHLNGLLIIKLENYAFKLLR